MFQSIAVLHRYKLKRNEVWRIKTRGQFGCYKPITPASPTRATICIMGNVGRLSGRTVQGGCRWMCFYQLAHNVKWKRRQNLCFCFRTEDLWLKNNLGWEGKCMFEVIHLLEKITDIQSDDCQEFRTGEAVRDG